MTLVSTSAPTSVHNGPVRITPRRPRLSLGLVGTFPPTQCGIATFTAALHRTLADHGGDLGVVELVDGVGLVPRSASAGVVHQWRHHDRGSLTEAIDVLDRFDATIIQHEYGIFGGRDGDEVLELVDRTARPTIVVLHTVLRDPSLRQRSIIELLGERAGALVVMSEAARRRLLSRYRVPPGAVSVIPHGAADNRRPLPPPGDRPVILTWGLLGPGKGIEWVIDGLDAVRGLDPAPRYLVAGETHPKVKAAHGETYRQSLLERAQARGVAHLVEFDDRYRSVAQLNEVVAQASVVVLPYESTEQITSGVLVDALASGRPVVATAFPHALEVLEGGAGVIVPHGDPAALGRALRDLLTDRDRLEAMAQRATSQAVDLLWPAVGERYLALAHQLVADDFVATA